MNQSAIFSDLSRKDKTDFYIALVVIFLSGLFILYFAFPVAEQTAHVDSSEYIFQNSKQVSDLNIENKVYLPLDKSKVEKAKYKHTRPIRRYPLPAKVESTRFNNVIKLYPDAGKIKSKESIVEKPTVTADIVKETNHIKVTKSTLVDSTTIEINVNKDNPDISSKSSVIAYDKKEEVVTEAVNTEECIILIGAFRKQGNISKLNNSLNAEGYRIFSTPYKSTTRIGVYMPCNIELIENELVKIRKKYAKDAMVLKTEDI